MVVWMLQDGQGGEEHDTSLWPAVTELGWTVLKMSLVCSPQMGLEGRGPSLTWIFG